ncbi:hypothetical protein [Dehalogenimonas sp. 4OHTPN]|uniref:Peptidase M6-like domain-containing protein n=1 Tax=Dehalogenimonas sp. 4OHTPN TaxID=3166643 RepID=A0AAU8G967_9CHLR
MLKKVVSRFTAVLLVLGVLVLLLPAAVPIVAAPKGLLDLIAVDADPYYKSMEFDEMAISASQSWSVEKDLNGVITRAELLVDGSLKWFQLRALGEWAEIWVAEDLSYPVDDPRPTPVITDDQIAYLIDEFDANIYESNTKYFGKTVDRDGTGDGIPEAYQTDNPQRVMILVFNIIDEGYYDPDYPFYIAGYFAPAINEEFNRNIIHIDSHDWANRVGPDVSRPFLYESTIAHEYEHAIHYDRDADEPSWVDEGMADLSGYLAGYGHPDDHIAYYLVYHRTPLTTWGGGLESYGASYLFQFYLMENFGGSDFISALVGDPANGIQGIENQLATAGYVGVTFDQIFRDWTLANYLDRPEDEGLSGATLGYEALNIPSPDTRGYSIQWSIKNYYGSDNHGNIPLPRYWGGYKSGTVQYPLGTLMPYTPMYLTYKGAQPQLVSNFRGADTSGVAPKNGNYELFGGRGDLLETKATLTLPVTLGANAMLSFQSWYEIEEAWDFGFVQISTDGGSTWRSLSNANTTIQHDPSAIESAITNLPGFTGSSGGWVHQEFDLAAYAGQSVRLRFLYITDWATNEAGFYVDDIIVSDNSGVLFSDGLESGSGNWDLEGWTHTTGLVGNDWSLVFVNPLYINGKLSEYQVTDSAPILSDGFQRDTSFLNTMNLGKDEVTIIVFNFQPENANFPADYRLLVETGNNRK